MTLYEIRWDRREKKFMVKEPHAEHWFTDWDGAYQYAFQVAKRNAPATVKHYKADGSVREYQVKPYPLKRFS